MELDEKIYSHDAFYFRIKILSIAVGCGVLMLLLEDFIIKKFVSHRKIHVKK